MKVEYNKWKIEQGKNGRICLSSEQNVEVHGVNDIIFYNYNELRDLAVAILKYEKAVNEENSILNKV